MVRGDEKKHKINMPISRLKGESEGEGRVEGGSVGRSHLDEDDEVGSHQRDTLNSTLCLGHGEECGVRREAFPW